MRNLYEQYDYWDCYLFESNHFSEIFEDCIDEITDNIVNYELNMDTGWYYNSKTYSVNKNNQGIQINVWYLDLDDNSLCGQVLNANKNTITILVNSKLCKTHALIKSTLLHEFVHMIKIYASNSKIKKEMLASVKDSFIKEFKIHWNLNDLTTIVKLISSILYQLTPNELLASINTVCKYLDTLSRDEVFNIIKKSYIQSVENDQELYNGTNVLSKQALIFYILKSLDNLHFLTTLSIIVSKFLNYKYTVQLLVGYYLEKYTFIHGLKYITYNNLFMFINNHFSQIDDNKFLNNVKPELYSKVYKYIENVYKKYKKDILNAIYHIMKKKNLFLTKDDIIKLTENSSLWYQYDNLIYD